MNENKFFRMKRTNNYDEKEGYFSCQEIEGAITFVHGALKMCGHVHSTNKGMPHICEYSGGDIPFEKIRDERKKLTEKNQTQEDTPCKGCEFLEKRKWEKKDYLINHITVGHYTPCNLRCTYCYTTKYTKEEFKIFNKPPYNSAESIQKLVDANVLSTNTTAWLTGGEPTMFFDFKELIEVLNKNDIKTTIGTNCTLDIIDEVKDGVRNNLIEILCSIDAGTKEKYKEVKGKDLSDKVWKNLKEYNSVNSNNVVVKYIYMDNNYSNEEVETFIDNCLSSGIKNISISRDILTYDGTLSSNKQKTPEIIMNSIAYMASLASLGGINVFFSINWPVFNNYELIKLEEIVTNILNKKNISIKEFMEDNKYGKIDGFFKDIKLKNNDIYEFLCCPDCKSNLIRENDKLICNKCEIDYPIINNVPTFKLDAINNNITAQAFSQQWDSYNNNQYEDTMVFGLSSDDYINHFCYAFSIDDIYQLDGTIVEIGIGSGHLLKALAEKATKATIIGIDISENVFYLSKELEKYKNIHLIQADLLELPIKKESIDYVYSSGVLHHTEDTFISVSSIWKIVKRDTGKMYFWIYPSYQFCAYDKLRNLLGKPYLYRKNIRYLLSKLLAPFLWFYFLISKNYSYKNNLETLKTVQFRIFDNISPEFQHRTSKEDIESWCKKLEIKDYSIMNDLGVLCKKGKSNDT